MPKRLTLKQQRFIDEYIKNGGNATKAIIATGYSGTYKAARVTAHRLLTNANINEAITKRKAELAKKAEITIERQLQEYDTNKEMARAKGQIPAANHALDSQTKIIGGFQKNNQTFVNVTPLPPIVFGASPKKIESEVKSQLPDSIEKDNNVSNT